MPTQHLLLELGRELGVLRTLVSESRDGIHRHIQVTDVGIHRRLDYQDRMDEEWRRHFLRKVDKPTRNGNGHSSKIPYGKAACLMGLLIIGIMGHVWPGSVKKASVDLVERLLIGQVRGGG